MVENGIKCAFPGRRTYVFSVDNFSGKAREHVFSLYLSTSPFNLSTTTTAQSIHKPNEPAHHTSTSATVKPCYFPIVPHDTTA